MPPAPNFESFSHAGAAARRHEREFFSCAVQVLTPERRIVDAQMLDLSLGGMKLVLPHALQIGSRCGVRFFVPAGPFSSRVVMADIEITSLILSGREGGFLAGVRFTDVPETSLASLRSYLQERFSLRAHRSRMRRPVHQDAALVISPAQEDAATLAPQDTALAANAVAASDILALQAA
jgi:hypothetical protein